MEEIITVVEKELTISKVEEDKFRYTGVDVTIIEDGIEISRKNIPIVYITSQISAKQKTEMIH